MHARLRWRRGALCAGLAAMLPLGPALAEPVAYHGFTLIDPLGRKVVPGSYLVVDHGRILAAGRGDPPASIPAERRHDLSGRYALPGFIDTHAHVTWGPVKVEAKGAAVRAYIEPDAKLADHNGRMLLAHGITTIRNTGGDLDANLAYDKAVAEGRLSGPEQITAGAVIDRTALVVEPVTVVPTAGRPVGAIVRDQLDRGADFVKLYHELTEADLAEGVAAAHGRGAKAVAHLGKVSWTRAAEIGVDGLVHAFPISPELLSGAARERFEKGRGGVFSFFEWYEQADLGSPEISGMVRTLAERKVHVDATLVAFEAIFWGDDPSVTGRHLRFAYPASAEHWKTFRMDAGWTADDYRRAKAVWPKVLQFTRMLHAAGVPMTLGTDTAMPFVGPGASFAREMRLHADAGLSHWDILRMATSDAAELIGAGDTTGRLLPGFEADVVFLDADPVRDIGAVSQVAAVLSDGALHRPSDLLEARP